MSRTTCLLLAAAASVYVMIDGPGVAKAKEHVRGFLAGVAPQPAPMPTPQPASNPSVGIVPGNDGTIYYA